MQNENFTKPSDCRKRRIPSSKISRCAENKSDYRSQVAGRKS